MTQYLAAVEVSALDGANGFTINGVDSVDHAGISVAAAGDINGDGLADFLIGANTANDAYLIFGSDQPFTSELELSSLQTVTHPGEAGYHFDGVGAAGNSVASAGDVNNDGNTDFIIGDWQADGFNGRSYLVFGGALKLEALDALNSPTEDGRIDLADLDGANGFAISGEVDVESGMSVASAGDINDDGYADLIIGATDAADHGTMSGAAYVVFGAAGGFDAVLNLSMDSLDGTNGFKIIGESANDIAGESVDSVGDVNDDGFDDLIVGAPDASTAYIVFGTDQGFADELELSSLDGTNGFRVISAEHQTGCSVAQAGDVNADGIPDFIVGASFADGPGGNPSDIGASFLIFGTHQGFGAELDLDSLDGSDGFRIGGDDSGDQSGGSVASAGDFNGDGFDDLIIGARRDEPNGFDSGSAYVVFGKASGFAVEIDLGSLDGDNGFRINGEAANDQLGISVASAGDVNGDGFADLIAGAAYADPNGAASGACYVIFGSRPAEAVTRTGTNISNTIHGSDFNDTLNGVDGNDTLIGYNGSDTLTGGKDKDFLDGGSGTDLLYGGADKDNLFGGNSNDTLDGGGNKDELEGGGGNDTFAFGAASDSTSADYDVVRSADFSSGDLFDTTVTVSGVDSAVTTGALSKNTFDTNLASAVGSGQLGAHHAVLFTPNSGDLSGKTFLIVDLNNSAGYQASADLVIQLSNSVDIGSFAMDDFI